MIIWQLLLWFKPNLTTINPTATLLDGLIDDKGLKLSTTTKDHVVIRLNGDTHNVAYNAPITSDAWYGLVFNLNNKYNQISTDVYRLEPGSNFIPSNSTQESNY